MRTTLKTLVLLIFAGFASGCASVAYNPMMSTAYAARASGETASEQQRDRMLIWNAHLTIEVWNVSNSVAQAVNMAQQSGGYVEQKSGSGEDSASLKLRIPMNSFTNALSTFESLGTVQYRYVQSRDVTEEYIDVDARLKNLIILRNRLRQLLDKATEVKDILAIETELNRIQGDIDSLEGRIKSLKGQVDLATIDLTLTRKKILGPLGYLVKGVWWTVEKLFVIRD